MLKLVAQVKNYYKWFCAINNKNSICHIITVFRATTQHINNVNFCHPVLTSKEMKNVGLDKWDLVLEYMVSLKL